MRVYVCTNARCRARHVSCVCSLCTGLLFATTAGNSDRVELALSGGRIRLSLRIEDTYKVRSRIDKTYTKNVPLRHTYKQRKHDNECSVIMGNVSLLRGIMPTGNAPCPTSKFRSVTQSCRRARRRRTSASCSMAP